MRAANRALADVEGLRNTLRGWFGFYDGYDPLFTWWMHEPYKAADQALQAYADFLRQRFGAVVGGHRRVRWRRSRRPRRRGRRRRRRRRRGRIAAGGGGGGGAGGRGGAAAAATTRPGGPREPLRPSDDIVGNPIGREALLSELEYEMISYSPEELIELAATS